MTNGTYLELEACARRRLAEEWVCTDAEAAILALLNELSYGLGQSWAVVPCLMDFADACGFHKSSISRAVRSCVNKGYLLVMMRQGETLYQICTEKRGQVRANPQAKRDQARRRLLELNRTRDAGAADVDGQQRIPGILPSEELEAPARAFEAIMEVPETPEMVPHGTDFVRQEQPIAGSVDPLHDRLEKLARTFAEQEARGELPVDPPTVRSAAAVNVPPRTNMVVGDFAAQWQQVSAGLSGQILYALDRVREECSYGGPSEKQAFFQFRFVWRKRAMEQPGKLLEACGEHKDMRLQGQTATRPGAFIYRSWTQLVGSAVPQAP